MGTGRQQGLRETLDGLLKTYDPWGEVGGGGGGEVNNAVTVKPVLIGHPWEAY